VLVFRPDVHDRPAYRGAVVGSFVATTWGFVGLAATAASRRRRRPRGRIGALLRR